VTLSSVGAQRFQLQIHDHQGTLIKQWRFAPIVDAFREGAMMHVAATFDAKANLVKVYANGVSVNPEVAALINLDSSLYSFFDSDRFLALGGAETLWNDGAFFFEKTRNGTMGNCLFWDSVLSPNEIRQVYRSGPIFDPFNNRYGYASSRNLIHCYRWDNHDGVTMNSVGEDRVGSYTADLEFTGGMTLYADLQQGGYGTIIRP
jgi:hypothetical protein